MVQRVLVTAALEKEIASLEAALEMAGYVPQFVSSTGTYEIASKSIKESVQGAALLVVVVPPPGPRWRRTVIDYSRQFKKPILLLATSASRRLTGELRSFTTMRSDFEDVRPIVEAIRALLKSSQGRTSAAPLVASPALDREKAHDWASSIESAFRGERFERQVSMMLSDAGVELSPPIEEGPDFIGWTDDPEDILGNPFLIEIKQGHPVGDISIERTWLSRSGLRTLLLLTGAQDADVTLMNTSDGNTIIYIPVLEFAEELGNASFPEAVRSLVQRTGVSL